ncbi:MAG: glycosyltransferase [Alphaproteobacteria bacterium]
MSAIKAVFVSNYSPGHATGGSQCTLAMLQAVSAVHESRVDYLGPAFMAPKASLGVEIANESIAKSRPFSRKALGLINGLHVDRTSPLIDQILDEHDPSGTIVYASGDECGKTVCTSVRRGFRTVYLPHNYPIDWLKARKMGLNGHTRGKLVNYWSKRAFAEATVALTLTKEDRASFEKALGAHRQKPTFSDMYFGYKDPNSLSKWSAPSENRDFRVLIATTLALPENEEGVIEILDHAWPKISHNGQAHLDIAGSAPSAHLEARVQAAGNRVSLSGSPSTTAMEDLFSRASVTIASTRKGSGIKLRVADSLRRGLPVITTRHCAIGYDDVSTRVLRVYETAGEAVRHLQDLMSENRDALAELAIKEYDRLFSYDSGVNKIARVRDAALNA